MRDSVHTKEGSGERVTVPTVDRPDVTSFPGFVKILLTPILLESPDHPLYQRTCRYPVEILLEIDAMFKKNEVVPSRWCSA
jgi:hypothetical protein